MNIFRLFMIFRMSGVFIIAKPMAATEIDIPTLVRSATSFNTIWENDVKILTQQWLKSKAVAKESIGKDNKGQG